MKKVKEGKPASQWQDIWFRRRRNKSAMFGLFVVVLIILVAIFADVIADYQLVDSYVEQHYPLIPRLLVLAPVCRPGWLVEVECLAIKSITGNQFPDF